MALQTAMAEAESYLLSKLQGSGAMAGLVGDRIYRGKAPDAPDFPLIIFAYQAGSYQKVVGGARYVSSLLYAIRAISRIPSTIAEEVDLIAATFDKLLENDSASPVLLVECETPLQREYMEGPVTYEERGGLYRILIQGG